MKPFLRWAGSKRALLPQLTAYWSSEYKRYIEPFMGSACLYFSTVPVEAILGDINFDLVNCYASVRDHPVATFNAIRRIPLGSDSYYKLRGIAIPEGDKVQRAARFIFLNRFCFNGLYRTNLAGQFNVPYSSSGGGSLPTRKQLISISKCLDKTKLIAADFETVLDFTRAGDFVYMDPPYAVNNRRVFREYTPDAFGPEDLYRLSMCLDELDSKGVKFVVSYAYCAEACEVFREWSVRKIFVQRNISGFSHFRRKAAEVIVTNIEINQRGS